MRWRERDGVPWLETGLPGATVAFTTREGGISEAPFDALNLGVFTEDDPGRVAENRRRLATALGFELERIVIGRQVHGAELAHHTDPQASSPFAPPGYRWAAFAKHRLTKAAHPVIPAVDGHSTAAPSLPLLILVADCLPVALSGPGGVAMLHCGWRGLAAGIVARGVEAVEATDAAIGPGIGPCCYEVGAEVIQAFDAPEDPDTLDRSDPPTGRKRRYAQRNRPVGKLDLVEVASRLLREAGVERIEAAGLCTSCEAERFFSHRRDGGKTGRQAGLVWRHEESA